jgi:hypothetical protein
MNHPTILLIIYEWENQETEFSMTELQRDCYPIDIHALIFYKLHDLVSGPWILKTNRVIKQYLLEINHSFN